MDLGFPSDLPIFPLLQLPCILPTFQLSFFLFHTQRQANENKCAGLWISASVPL